MVYKSLKILELNPKNLTNEDSFNDLFFERIDEIDNMVVRGEDLDSIKASFNLDGDITLTFDAEFNRIACSMSLGIKSFACVFTSCLF